MKIALQGRVGYGWNLRKLAFPTVWAKRRSTAHYKRKIPQSVSSKIICCSLSIARINVMFRNHTPKHGGLIMYFAPKVYAHDWQVLCFSAAKALNLPHLMHVKTRKDISNASNHRYLLTRDGLMNISLLNNSQG